ncbi:hypothetical protein NDU88_002794 [Pleurodeles waltl]|uniref:Uncharacterized protein n=1 Tax=Pleurodeles waltl TaxID=8319 RepID=A0AAV7LQ87_PLEWA|nr:hypothetical protein NDU88_002794 [Pleurodeles waltl]
MRLLPVPPGHRSLPRLLPAGERRPPLLPPHERLPEPPEASPGGREASSSPLAASMALRPKAGPSGAPGGLPRAVLAPGAPTGARLLLIIKRRFPSCPGGTVLSADLALRDIFRTRLRR